VFDGLAAGIGEAVRIKVKVKGGLSLYRPLGTVAKRSHIHEKELRKERIGLGQMSPGRACKIDLDFDRFRPAAIGGGD